MKRVFLIVLDSVGIGELPDAGRYGDIGSNTLLHVSEDPAFFMPNLKKLGLCDIPDTGFVSSGEPVDGAYGKMAEASAGKDTTTGHWEIAGLVSSTPFPTYPEGFPEEIIREFEEKTGRPVLCNLPYSGTDVILDYGREQEKTGGLIVYTSADSVFQIAAHEDVIPLEELYRDCEIARKMLTGPYNVGRVIARPFTGTYPDYVRTSGRHDYSVVPPADTMLTLLQKAGKDVLSVGKIIDIFAEQGITDYVRTVSNEDGVDKTLRYMEQDFEGLCFTNLVEFDMNYGHRNDRPGYAKALADFDRRIPEILERMREEDLLIITADHGCDPTTASTDHSREYVPLFVTGAPIRKNICLGIRNTFADIGATVLDYFRVPGKIAGTSMLEQLTGDAE